MFPYLDDASHHHLLHNAGVNIGNIQARLDGGAAQSGSTEFLTLCCPIENFLVDIYLKNWNPPYLQFSSHGA